MERKCYNCKNYCALVNQGYWWCNKNLDMDHPETCEGWDEVPQANTTSTTDWSTSSATTSNCRFKVAIVGSRTFTDYDLAEKFIDKVCEEDYIPIEKIISGGAKGADTIAEEYARKHNIDTQIFKPDWEKYGKSAGFRRNKDIIENCDICIAFWDGESKGTKHDIDLCKKLNKLIYICRV